jgi:hypothetical protein
VLLATPHLEPNGLVVAVTGVEIVAQLLTNAHTATAANAFHVLFIIFTFDLVNNIVKCEYRKL